MAHYKFDLVQETSTSTGTGALTLAGAVTRRRAFSAVLSNADTCYVLIESASAAEWEICLATYNSGGNTLSRGAVLASSTGSAVSFSAGTKTISMVAPAAKSIVEDNNGDVSITRDLAVGRNATVAGTLGVTGGIIANYPIQSIFTFGNLTVLESVGGYGFRWATANDQTVRLQKTADGFSSASTPIYIGTDGKVGINETTAPAARLHITQADGIFSLGISGTTKGIRVSHAAGYSRIEGVDNTLGASQQPLQLDGSVLQLATANTIRWYLDAATGGFFGNVDNVYSLGGPSNRASVVYAGTGTINTSGRASKLFIAEAIAAEKRAAATIKAKPRRYKLKDSVDEKGEARARWHFGYIAEDVRDALAAEGLDPWSYAFLCSDPITKTETYTAPATRPKTRKVAAVESAVEIIDGKPVMVRSEVERDEPVGEMVAVTDEAGEPVLQQTGSDEEGAPILAPMMHFVQETEEYEEERTREVDSGEVRLGLRYSELEAFLRSAD